MATLGSESQPFSSLPVSALVQPQYPQQHHSAITGVTNFSLSLPINRGLERALEEAANSGILNLSARKLKEFPRTSGNHDFSDTVQADVDCRLDISGDWMPIYYLDNGSEEMEMTP